jgi:segregation and condensation protein A
MDYNVKLDIFEGPLDLLLHLIRKNEMDIYDIPIAVITEQYLEYLELMKELNIHIAGNFLVMAATLIHIKSRMLLPRPPEEEEEEDPRMELTRPLLEYLQFKEAAERLSLRPLLYRDVFTRDFPAPELAEKKEEGLIRVGIFELMDAVRRIFLERKEGESVPLPSPLIPIEKKMEEILARLQGRGKLFLEELVPEPFSRSELIVAFLALLELAKQQKIVLYQERPAGDILIYDFLPPAVIS